MSNYNSKRIDALYETIADLQNMLAVQQKTIQLYGKWHKRQSTVNILQLSLIGWLLIRNYLT